MYQILTYRPFLRGAQALCPQQNQLDLYTIMPPRDSLLAMGLADLVVEADLKPYDYMALVPIVKASRRRRTRFPLEINFEEQNSHFFSFHLYTIYSDRERAGR